jgi:hypothetical protein
LLLGFGFFDNNARDLWWFSVTEYPILFFYFLVLRIAEWSEAWFVAAEEVIIFILLVLCEYGQVFALVCSLC